MRAPAAGVLSRAEAVALTGAGLYFVAEGIHLACLGFATGWLLAGAGVCAVVVAHLARRGAP